VKGTFVAERFATFRVKWGGSVTSEGPLRRDGNSFLSGVLNIEWLWGCLHLLEGVADAGGDAGSRKSPALKPEPRKWSNPPAKHFDPIGRM